MLEQAIEKKDETRQEDSEDEYDYLRYSWFRYPERKRRRSNRNPLERRLSRTAASLAPKSSTSPEILFHSYRPRLSISSAPEESALGVLAQVAHELEPTCVVSGDYFADPNVLPTDLAESLINMYSL
jgi:hypothetical protein